MRLLCLFLLLLAPMPVMAGEADRDTLYQVATIESLMQGVYDTGITCGALLEHGDLGLGTFQDLDGEMLVLDGTVWQIRGSGDVVAVADVVRTPFACVTHFEQERLLQLRDVKNFDDLAARIKQAVADTPNMIFALRIHGHFSHVRTRSVDRQHKPYPPLIEAVKNQPEFRFENRAGDLVGFFMPAMLQGLNVPGLHLHFLTQERDAGGHVLDVSAESMDVWLDATPLFSMLLPGDPDFQKADLDGATGDDLHEIER